MTPQQRYQQDLTEHGFRADASQAVAVEFTENLYVKLTSASSATGLLKRLTLGNKEPIKGLYFWGGVGRGKTYLIDCFFECLPFAEKKRIHFNHFMQQVHGLLQAMPRSPDPLKIVAKQFAESFRVLCLDEFHVDDITDAMILAGLLQAMFDRGITLVTTSNIPVDDLYLNGLQRSRFMPAIALLKQHTHVVHLESDTDYRLALLEKSGTYHVIENQPQSELIMREEFLRTVNEAALNPQSLLIKGRAIKLKAMANNVLWADFAEMCETARSSVDYIELARNYSAIFLSDVPIMKEGKDDAAQRFIQLIDAFYDHHVKLVISAAAMPQELYQGHRLSFPFQRTISRLHEMRSHDYLAAPHLP